MTLFCGESGGSMLQKRKLHAVRSGRLVRAMPRVSVEAVMTVLSEQRPRTLSVASEAWKSFCSSRRLS